MEQPEAMRRHSAGAPSLALFLAEGQRALLEGLALPAARPLLRRAPRGDGHAVLVLPGFMADDGSTRALRGYLRGQGFYAHAWRLGRNRGPSDAVQVAMTERVEALFRRDGRKLSIVGWSLGGIYARELAKRMPHAVRQVVTLGSPFADPARESNVSRLYDWMSKRDRNRNRSVDRRSVDRHLAAERLRPPPDVPSTAIYSKTDGVVHWEACLEPERPHTENIEVPGSHCGLGFNAPSGIR
jgi:pimeloyl-ACP methyl ester carboxylesterase